MRDIVGDLALLVPGVGAQGGEVAATVQAGQDSTGLGLVINSSRAVLYASSGEDFAQAALAVATATRDEIRLVSPGFYLGKVYWGKDRLIDFCLQF